MAEGKSVFKSWQFYVSLACVLTINVLITFPKGVSGFKYLYQTGHPWAYEDLISPIDFPILKTESEILLEMEEKSSSIVQCFMYDDSQWTETYNSLKTLLKEKPEYADCIPALVQSLKYVYDVGVIDIEKPGSDIFLIRRGNHAKDVASTSVFTLASAKKYIRETVSETDSLPAEFKAFVNDLYLEDYLTPNLIFNEEKTELLHRQAVRDISPTKGMFYAGGLIVSEGEIVTPEIAQLIDSYKQEDASIGGGKFSVTGLAAGRVMISLILLASIIAIAFFTGSIHILRWRDFYFILTLTILMYLFTYPINRLSTKYIFMVPYPVFALYLMSFYRRSLAFPLYAIMVLPLLLMVQNGVCHYFTNIIAGITVMVSFRYLNKGWHQFVNAFYIFLALVISFIAFTLLWNGGVSLDIITPVWMMFASSLLVVFFYPLVYVFEKVFSLLSTRRLLELGDINNKLLREMSLKAPGSFQHSLQVANLAGEAARELGVNEALVRAGALYHDIGKLKNPLCFVENQPVGMQYHAELTPEESARQIINHVDDGVEMAKKNNLPQEVIDFILTHHAQSLASYFYNTYVKNGGNPENKEPFTYHGNLPTTEEQVILMMADSIEAASRTLEDYSEENISSLVNGIVDNRLKDSQLINANIPVRDLTRLKEIFVQKISQIYHTRVSYPKL